MALQTGRVVDVVKQTDEAPHGGEGWVGRETTMPQELGTLWAECGVTSEYGELKSVLMRTPGPEIEAVTDPRPALWYDLLDPIRAREQHAATGRLLPIARRDRQSRPAGPARQAERLFLPGSLLHDPDRRGDRAHGLGQPGRGGALRRRRSGCARACRSSTRSSATPRSRAPMSWSRIRIWSSSVTACAATGPGPSRWPMPSGGSACPR